MKTIINPDLYHGKNKDDNFFEGWYFKIVDKNNKYKFAFIPGVAFDKKHNTSHSFIQIVDGYNVDYNYLSFNANKFKFNNNNFKISVDNNTFSLKNIKLNLSYLNKSNNTYKSIKGNLDFVNTKKWDDNILNPGSMGFYNYFSFMECYSQVCLVNGGIKGSLLIDSKNIDFTGGSIYIEKNWGKSFPTSWIWIQSNNFKEKDVSVTCSLGKVPFLVTKFTGFLIGVTVKDKFYKFTTMNLSKVKIKKYKNDISLIAYNNKYKLTLKTYSNNDEFVLCMGPKNGNMIPLVNETINGKVHMILKDIKNNKIIYDGVGFSTGIEYGGENTNMLDK